MNDLSNVHHVSVSLARPLADVYRFARDGKNLSKWASGLGEQKVEGGGDDWTADGPLGKVKIHFAPTNELGVMDHDVTLPNGVTVHNPFRVLPNGKNGSTLVFSVIQQSTQDDAAFAADVKHVEKDLATLKKLLEKAS